MKGFFNTQDYLIIFKYNELAIAKFSATITNKSTNKIVKCLKATSMEQLMNDVSFYFDYNDINIYE